MPRTAFELSALLGISTTKVSSIAAAIGGERLFLGTVDGSLVAYECRGDSANAIRAGSFDCNIVEVLRKGGGKERRPISDLSAIEKWRAVLGIIDNQLMAFDLHTYRPIINIPESKGASCFCHDENSNVLYVGSKKRMQIFSWQSVGVTLRREIALPDTPRAITCAPASNGENAGISISSGRLILALKGEYFILDTESGVLSLPLQLSGQSGTLTASPGISTVPTSPAGVVMISLKASAKRGPRVLLSSGSKGILVDVNGQEQEESLSWSSPPLAAQFVVSFFIAALPSQIEIHDAASLAPVQIIDMSGVLCMASCTVNSSRGGFSYIGTMQAVSLLKMIPIQFQVNSLVDSGNYEEALTLCSMCQDNPVLLGGVAVSATHERYAYDLFSWGDYEGAVTNFVKANTPLPQVLALFPSLLPPELPHKHLLPSMITASSPRPLGGVSLSRAAGALVKYLEMQHNSIFEAAMASENTESDAHAHTVLLDTVLVSARLHCSPPRREAIISQLSDVSRPSRCDIAALAPVLASAGAPFVEALLWLYRSKNLHKEVLGMLSETRCVGEGGWSKDDYRKWVAQYLQTLWFSEDSSHPPLALQAAAPLIVADPRLGLTVFTGTGAKTKKFDRLCGTDARPQDAVSLFKTIVLEHPENIVSQSSEDHLPLTNGRSLAIRYLEHILEDSTVTDINRKMKASLLSQLHDELAYLLMEGLLSEQHSGDLKSELAELYQRKLRKFLQTSKEYNPARLLAVVPSHFLIEHALLLSRLGRHNEVLGIYVSQLKDAHLAEEYCDQIWRQWKEVGMYKEADGTITGESKSENKENETTDADVYLCLLKAYLSQQEKELYEDAPLSKAISLLERYFTRIDPLKVLEIIPPDTPLSRLNGYFGPAMRHHESQLRQAQVIHNLCKADHVNVKYELLQLQSSASCQPDLTNSFSHLGPIRHSSSPTEISDLNAECGVSCIRHALGTHVVLQFNVTSRNRGNYIRLVRVSVHCESNDRDVVTVVGQRALPALPAGGTGSCYSILSRGQSGGLSTSVTCELRYGVVGVGRVGEYEEEFPLEDVEITADDLL